MATIMPYIPQNPGDLITAENWNDMQVKIQQDILDKMKKAEDDVKAGTVAKAQDAATVDGKSVTDLTDDFKKLFALINHQHEGMAARRRYFKQFTTQFPNAFLHHGLHWNPIVQAYHLADVVGSKQPSSDKTDYTGCKFLFFRKHQDADPYGLYVSSGRDNELIGVPFDELINEFGVDVKDDDSIEDAIGDFWDEFLKEPNDKIDYCQTPWVRDCCDKNRTVGELKHSGDWADLYIGFRPDRCGLGSSVEPGQPCELTVKQVNYDAVYVEASPPFIAKDKVPTGQPPTAVVMFLLRS